MVAVVRERLVVVLVVWKPLVVLVVDWKRLPVVVVGGGRVEVEGVRWQVVVGLNACTSNCTRVQGTYKGKKKISRTHVRIIVRAVW